MEKDATICKNNEADDRIWQVDQREKKYQGCIQIFKVFVICNKTKRLSSHRYPLKERMMDRMVSYIDLLQQSPPPSRTDDELKPQTSSRLAQCKWSWNNKKAS
jgi:hypothetical protein